MEEETNENVGAEGAVGTPPPADVPVEPTPEVTPEAPVDTPVEPVA